MSTRIGVISDTHNYLDPQIARHFQGVDHILHGGDVGMPRLILELEQISPVTAVLGNTDDGNLGLRLTESVELDGLKFLVHHIVNPLSLEAALKQRIERDRPAVVVFGHSHKPFNQTIDGTLYFNPGYAGHSRFGMNRSVALLHCDGGKITSEYLSL